MSREQRQTTQKTLCGVSIAPGMARGTTFVYRDILHRDYELYDIEEHQIDEEHQRIKQAIDEVRQDLHLSAIRVKEELNTELAQIFQSQETILSDAQLGEEIGKVLRQDLVNAEHVIQRVLRRWERRFREMEDAVLSQRAEDIADLNRRLLRALRGIHAHALENLPDNTVLVAKRLLPSDTVYLSRQSTAAVVVECGGTGSHAALLTRALGIPAVGQIPDVLRHLQSDELALVDGSNGTVVIAPNKQTRTTFERQMQAYQVYVTKAKQQSQLPAITIDGRQIEVLANIGCREDAERAFEDGADGIGLYRIENVYLAQKVLPSEQELFDALKHAVQPAGDNPVTVRLLDVGGDKELPFLSLPAETDPTLGRRGIRLLLDYPELLKTQLKVMLRLAQRFDLRILVPMVTLAEEMQQVRQLLHEIAAPLGFGTFPLLGAMLETPAAALCVTHLIAYSDFFSIGTNDLTQYTMAASRENPRVSRYFRDSHPAVMSLLRHIVQHSSHTSVSVCGELAGNLDEQITLLSIGIRSLSVPPPLVSLVKEKIRTINLHQQPRPRVC